MQEYLHRIEKLSTYLKVVTVYKKIKRCRLTKGSTSEPILKSSVYIHNTPQT